MTTPAQHATALAAAIAAYASDHNQTALSASLKTALDAYDDVGGLSADIKALIASNETFLASVRFFDPAGAVESVDDLPIGRPTGEYWLITDGPNAGYGFLRVGDQWVDMGPVRGPTGVTPAMSFAVEAVGPDVAPSAAVSGAPETPLIHLALPRGRNARSGIALSIAYRMEAGEVLATYVSTVDEAFDASAVRAVALTPDPAGAVITIKRGATTWGTLTWAAGETDAAVSIPDPTNPAGGVLVFRAPPEVGHALANIAINIPGAVS